MFIQKLVHTYKQGRMPFKIFAVKTVRKKRNESLSAMCCNTKIQQQQQKHFSFELSIMVKLSSGETYVFLWV